MLTSFFTPTHKPTHILETYQSIKNQQGDYSWEWVIVINGKITTQDLPDELHKDKRVVIIRGPQDFPGIGAIKNLACQHCRGDVFVELDHDDVLASSALHELNVAYSKEPNGFYYSDFINVRENGTCETFNKRFGWETYSCDVNNKTYIACRAFPPSARSLYQIFYAPNHIRAWSRSSYEKVQGHDVTLKIGDDHDLVCRTYIAGVPFVWIKSPIYIYRRWNSNSFVKYNRDIQEQQHKTGNKYLHKLIKEECRRNGSLMLDLGKAENCPSDFTNHTDIYEGLVRNSVGCIRLADTLQRIRRESIIQLMNQCYNVLRAGGWFLSATPSIDDGKGNTGRGAFQDPTYCSYWSENNFSYFYHKKHAHSIPTYIGRFQKVRLFTSYPSEWHQKNFVPYVYADLCALKEQRQPGECTI